MRGVTLIELIIVLGLTSMLASLGAIASTHEFDRALSWTDASRAAATDRHIRAEHMHGIPINL